MARHLVAGSELIVTDETGDILEADLEARPDIFSVKVWTWSGVLAWANLATDRIGRRFPVTHHLAEVL